ncbi:YjjW family glycine radical enzyme activase [Shewanella sp. UCD-KL12]|uniref:YjjW family glycine radical enzyme activase n=1 Tax=Shewanella sp. UCD-KL12 TaxID=1917163 RepID=UPI000970E90C|nr:YjjW family glycine radical enzyme activase [Shewanella sp. UCD-KL12]
MNNRHATQTSLQQSAQEIQLDKRALVSQIIKFSTVDGPGSRLVLFLQGCNYQCKSCHNPHTIELCDSCGDCVSHCPAQALTMIIEQDKKQIIHWNRELCSHCDTCLEVCPKQSSPKTSDYTVSQILDLIRDQLHFITGITVSGGEATLQLSFITALFKAIKYDETLKHLSCMLDSNGSLSATAWEKLLPYVDGVMLDLKAWQQETHQYITGRGNHRVFQSIQLIAKYNKLYEVRLLQIPGVTDFEAEIDSLSDYLKRLPRETRIKLNAFQHHGVKGESLTWSVCTKGNIEQFAQQLTNRGVQQLVLPSFYN